MCGIAGFIGFDDIESLADSANRIQQHRGPDHQESWSDHYIALAHQRLSIIDLSEAANQPFHKGDWVIVFNGEIYNYQELRDQLKEEHQIAFISASDTEVILEGFRLWGAQCLDLLVGMFSLAIYNKKTKRLFLARDHFGIKPLFYTSIDGQFAFSSELKTLVAIPGLEKKINPKALVSSVNYYWVSGNDTMFQNFYKLPPGHYLWYTKEKGLEMQQYWALDDDPAEMLTPDEDAVIEALSDTLKSSIKRHMVADVPVSTFLSGGVDSSYITVLARKMADRLSAYTISMAEKDKKIEKMPDDEKFAKSIAEQFDIDHHLIKISPDILKDFPAMVRTLDEPIGDPAAINTYLICKAARAKGVKVLLSGMGADEIFFGYRRQRALLLSIKFNRLPAFVKKAIAKMVDWLPVRLMGRGFKLGRWAKRFMSFASLPLDQAFMRSYSLYDVRELKDLLQPDFKPAVEELVQEHAKVFDSKYKFDTVNRICHTETKMFMLGLNLTYSDRASMAASVEVRVPFIDKKVVQKAMQIPGRLKIKRGESKYVLKKAAQKVLPNEIIYRPKAAFSAPIRSWISNELKDMVDELLSKEVVQRRGFFNYTKVKQMIDNDRNGSEDNAYQIYQLLTLELWCREFLDTEVAKTPFLSKMIPNN